MQGTEAAFFLFFHTVLAGGPEAGAPPAGPPREAREPTRVKVEGALLSYIAWEVPAEKHTPEGENDFLRRASGTLLLERPVAFRRAQLPAGEYELRIENEGRGPILVIEAAPTGEGSDGAEREAGKPRPRRKTASPPPPAETAPALEKKSEREPRAPGGNGSGEDGEVAPRAGGGRRGAAAEGVAEPAEKEPPRPTNGAGRVQPVSTLRVPVTLAACEHPAEKLAFDLKISNRGTKLKVIIRAGNTEARASLRFADAAR